MEGLLIDLDVAEQVRNAPVHELAAFITGNRDVAVPNPHTVFELEHPLAVDFPERARSRVQEVRAVLGGLRGTIVLLRLDEKREENHQGEAKESDAVQKTQCGLPFNPGEL